MATVSNSLIIASSDFHTPHIFTTNGAIISRPSGHFGGITALCSFGSDCFITGSSDESTKLWDIRQSSSTHTFQKHKGIVTCVHSCYNSNQIFTGGIDGYLNVWDIRAGVHSMSSHISHSPVMKIWNNHLSGDIYAIASEKLLSNYYDLEKYGVFDDNAQYDSVVVSLKM